MKKNLMDRDAASRIQSATCKQNSGITPKGSFAARAMSAASRNEPIVQTTEFRARTNRSPNFFQRSQYSETYSEPDSSDENLMLALGVGALAIGTGLAIYAAAKEEEKEQESCCEKYCSIM